MDQIRNVQRSTRVGSASPRTGVGLRTPSTAEISPVTRRTNVGDGKTLRSWLALLTSDCAGAELRLEDVSQQTLLAHEPGWHPLLSDVFETRHDTTGSRAAAIPKEVQTSKARTLPNMRFY